MISVEYSGPKVAGISVDEAALVREFDPIRQADLTSLRRFVQSHRHLLTGRVLDFGAGRPGTCRKPEPYRDLVAGEYVPVDKGDTIPPGPYDAILSTQVMQYIPDPPATIAELARLLRPGGHLLIAYPTNWDEVEECDLWRFTSAGMQDILVRAGLAVVAHSRRAYVKLGHFEFPLGYGVVARKPGRRCTLDEEQSAAVLAGKIDRREPFLFLRYGDGALECLKGGGAGHTCDGEPYSNNLGVALWNAWRYAAAGDNVFAGDWLSASFEGEHDPSRYPLDWEALTEYAPKFEWLHFETLLWMTTRRGTKALAEFYASVERASVEKVLLAPAAMAPAAARLRCRHIATPMSGMFESVGKITEQLLATPFDLLLWGCGMAGTLPVVECWRRHPERQYVNIGSSLDPLHRGRTRSRQMSCAAVRKALKW
jgi:SAM-dependent methyltransferase